MVLQEKIKHLTKIFMEGWKDQNNAMARGGMIQVKVSKMTRGWP